MADIVAGYLHRSRILRASQRDGGVETHTDSDYSFRCRFSSSVSRHFGPTISPYLFFWQASQEVEEDIAAGKKTVAARKGASNDELRNAAWDVKLGMFFSNLFHHRNAATLFRAGKTDTIGNRGGSGTHVSCGRFATTLPAIGLGGAGML